MLHFGSGLIFTSLVSTCSALARKRQAMDADISWARAVGQVPAAQGRSQVPWRAAQWGRSGRLTGVSPLASIYVLSGAARATCSVPDATGVLLRLHFQVLPSH